MTVRSPSSRSKSRAIRVRVRGAASSYVVRVERGLLARAGACVRAALAEPGGGGRSGPRGRTVALVTDRTVLRLYGSRVEASLRRAGFRVVRSAIAPGEESKRFETVRSLAEGWERAGLTRDAVVVALGGGVVSDTAGFAAAAYSRGLPWIAFPTTTLAQADAAIGGKTGVNLDAGKNLLGAFHQPRGVFADPEALATLPGRAFRSGLAEVVKMGMIRRPAILRGLDGIAESLAGKRAARDAAGASLAPIMRECAATKAWYVEQDERDTGLRRELNFGHTVGHALEAAGGYRLYQHGEAVAVGMAAALRMSVLHAGLDPVDAQETERLIARLGLPTRIPRFPGERFWNALARDKKRGRTRLRVVLCPAIGSAEIFELSSLTSLRRVVESLVMRS
ncbi:MAG TPA: 3-dehydroquinate synthase [Candidatus Omnitrophota bacterium]|nr:3-dehydroquinate synthase [Candidatus Omnitrophota bacterium]